jgi:hypothetical protein
MPWLAQARSGQWALPAPGSLRISWPLGGGRTWHLLAQLAGYAGPPELIDSLPGRVVYRSHTGDQRLAAWSVRVAIDQAGIDARSLAKPLPKSYRASPTMLNHA